jgi:hypothetical protein
MFIVSEVEKPAIIFHEKISYLRDEFYSWCKERQVYLIGLPENTSHILNPFTISITDCFQKCYKDKAHDFKLQNNNKIILELDFIQIIKEVEICVPEELVKKSFEKSGIYPFDLNKN